jgi:glucosylceramidase
VNQWADTLYTHDAAKNFTTGIALHWYAGDNFDQIEAVHKQYPQAVILPSEATYEVSRYGAVTAEGSWSFGEGYAHDILGTLNAGAVGWTDWNMLLNKEGGPNHVGNNCDAALMGSGSDLWVHPQYWYIGHFSKYILRGSKRIVSNVVGSTKYIGQTRSYGTCDGRDGLQATGFQRADGKNIVVVLNCGDNALDFKLKDGDRSARLSIPAHGIQTYMFQRWDSRRLSSGEAVSSSAGIFV